jgi:hypothetical protein
MSDLGATRAPQTHHQEVYDMTIVRRASPLGELVSLRQVMDRLFEDSVVRPRNGSDGSTGLASGETSGETSPATTAQTGV